MLVGEKITIGGNATHSLILIHYPTPLPPSSPSKTHTQTHHTSFTTTFTNCRKREMETKARPAPNRMEASWPQNISCQRSPTLRVTLDLGRAKCRPANLQGITTALHHLLDFPAMVVSESTECRVLRSITKR